MIQGLSSVGVDEKQRITMSGDDIRPYNGAFFAAMDK